MTTALASRQKRPLKGIVTAIAAVSAVEDSVKDVIVPGAFAATLKRLRPKLVMMHDWHKPLGRVLRVEELAPGDKRLPKTLPDGRPWPKEGGAVIAVLQFHLGTVAGREAFEHCRQWHINGEAAFSIGYRVPDGMSSKRPDGVRMIYALDLYEISLVLHGAHNMALALEVKSADGADVPVREVKLAAEQAVEVPEDSVMVALVPTGEAAAALTVPGGCTAGELHVTIALPGAAELSDVVEAVTRAVSQHDPLAGHVGGLGIFPPSPSSSNGVPIFRTVDVPGLVELRQEILAALAAAGHPHQSEHGFTPHMTIGYNLPSVAPIENVPVRFDSVTVTRGATERVDVPLGSARMPAMTGKAALAVYEARLINALTAGDDSGAAVLEAKMLNACVGVPTLPRTHKTPPRKRRTPNWPQEVTA